MQASSKMGAAAAYSSGIAVSAQKLPPLDHRQHSQHQLKDKAKPGVEHIAGAAGQPGKLPAVERRVLRGGAHGFFFLVPHLDLSAPRGDDADKAAVQQHIGQHERQDCPQKRQAEVCKAPVRSGPAQPDERGSRAERPAIAAPFAASCVT